MSDVDSRTDSELVKSCLEGQAQAWEALLRRYQRLIFSIPFSYRLREPDAEEIFQRVAVRLFENLGKLRRTEAVSAWLVTTTRRECRAWVKESRRWRSAEAEQVDAADDRPGIVATLDQIRGEHTLRLALERLDSGCRDLLTLLYIADPTPGYSEIAERLGRPVGSLGPTRSRCLKKLRKLYEGLGGDPL